MMPWSERVTRARDAALAAGLRRLEREGRDYKRFLAEATASSRGVATPLEMRIAKASAARSTKGTVIRERATEARRVLNFHPNPQE